MIFEQLFEQLDYCRLVIEYFNFYEIYQLYKIFLQPTTPRHPDSGAETQRPLLLNNLLASISRIHYGYCNPLACYEMGEGIFSNVEKTREFFDCVKNNLKEVVLLSCPFKNESS
jgi:hypothetical protein